MCISFTRYRRVLPRNLSTLPNLSECHRKVKANRSCYRRRAVIRSIRAAALAPLVLAGCRTPPFTLAPPDVPDASCAGYDHPYLEERALVSLDTVDPREGMAHGRALRVLALLELRADCDLPGQIDVTVQPGNATDGVT